MPTVSITSPRPTTWSEASTRALSLSWPRAKVLMLACATVIAATVRIAALDTYGFSADEINKVRAIEQYRAGQFRANAEHPLLMKLAMLGSVEASEVWNRIAPADAAVPLETAVRLPNAVAGAVTTAVLFGVADVLFGGTVAAAAAIIWAFDVNAIAINRIGKEDTFLLLFFLTAVYCYERAKQLGKSGGASTQRWYTLSGAAFGLMLASKYMPHLIGVYALFNVLTDPEPGDNKPQRLRHFGAMAAAFVLANVTILLPSTWRYFVSYVAGDMLPHHGYLYAGTLYVTNVPISPLGVPPTFYVRLLATKVPFVVLAAFVAGAIELVRRRHERGSVLLRVLAVFVIVPSSLMAAKFLRYSLPMLATVDLIAALGLVTGIEWLLRKGWLSPLTRTAAAGATVAIFGAGIVLAQQTAAPYYSLFQNAVGEHVNVRPTAAFPEETYDYGVREAVGSIVAAAAPSAAILSDADAVVAHYLHERRRPDIAAESLSARGVDARARDTWVIVQDEHATFENQQVVAQLRARQAPWREVRIDGRVAAQIFHVEAR